MNTSEIYERCESDRTLAIATTEELKAALVEASREIHKWAISRELAYRERDWKCSRTDGMTKNRYSASMNKCGRPAVGDPIGDRVPITPTYVDRSSGNPGSPELEIVGDDSLEVEETLP